jgi:uncharacterized protein (DUF1501 family)
VLTIWGRRQPFCDGVSRRNFLRVGAFGAGLTLADQLRARASSPADGRTRPRSVVMVYLPGGPSHLDTYDPKPDAPAEFRGEFAAIPTSVPGIRVSEHLPLHARMMDKFALVRSLVSVDEHSDSLVMTGYTENANRAATGGQHPSVGAVVSKVRGGASADVPPFVSLRGMSIGTEPGFLGVAHRPFTAEGPGIRNLAPTNGVNPARLDDRRDLLARFDTARREIDATGTMAGMDAFTARAFDMIASGEVRKALDLKHEGPRARDRYKGVEKFLTARRLIEAGVGCVTLSYGGWDTHSGNFKELKRILPGLDRGVTNLVQDFHDRGMQDDVVTVVWGEFGRTPKINGSDAGRDHWSPVMSALVAGGGLKMGQAVGASSARGEYPKDRPYKVPHLLSTVYHAIGIDPAATFPNGSGRPMHVLDDRARVEELV